MDKSGEGVLLDKCVSERSRWMKAFDIKLKWRSSTTCLLTEPLVAEVESEQEGMLGKNAWTQNWANVETKCNGFQARDQII